MKVLAEQDYSIRRASLDDLEIIVGHRRAMMREIRNTDEALLEAMSEKFRPWLRSKLESDEYYGWLAIASDGSVAAGVGLWLLDWPASPVSIAPHRGYLLNVYTESAHRKQGLARRLVQTAMDWCIENGVDVMSLHASQLGRPLYESLEFVATNEMRLVLTKKTEV